MGTRTTELALDSSKKLREDISPSLCWKTLTWIESRSVHGTLNGKVVFGIFFDVYIIGVVPKMNHCKWRFYQGNFAKDRCLWTLPFINFTLSAWRTHRHIEKLQHCLQATPQISFHHECKSDGTGCCWSNGDIQTTVVTEHHCYRTIHREHQEQPSPPRDHDQRCTGKSASYSHEITECCQRPWSKMYR